MNTGLQFRRAVHGDDATLRELARELGSEPPPIPEFRRAFQQLLTVPHVSVWLALDGERVAGTFTLAIVPTLGTRCRPLALVENVMVAAGMQRRGIGRSMMDEAMRLAAAARCYKLMLSSNFSHPGAHEFYDALGFERHGQSFTLTLPDPS